MKLNQNTAISTHKVLLVPYERRHVPRYHEWMQDPALQEATASEPLSLAEEHENQASWRAAPDKLTFILCLPSSDAAGAVVAGEVDAPARMVGDINLFLSTDDDEGVVGEVDIMIAEAHNRGQGLGSAAVRAFLHWVWMNRGEILDEYRGGGGVLGMLMMAKIKVGNVGSIALFRGLGFLQEGAVNYFGEIRMVLRGVGGLEWVPEGFGVVEYRRGEVRVE